MNRDIFTAGRFPAAGQFDGIKPLSALIIHKNPLLAGEFKRTIKTLGEYDTTVMEAPGTDEALKLIYRNPFDVIFFDLESIASQNISAFVDFILQVPVAPVITMVSVEWAGLGRESVMAGAQDWLPIEGLNADLLSRSIGYAQDRFQLKETLRSMALVDSTTGLYNKTGFSAVALPQIQNATRSRRPYLLFSVDVPSLDEILEHHGQKERSNAMVLIAQALWHSFRRSDVIARTGIEEFAIYANDATTKSADIIIARVKQYLLDREKSEKWPFSLNIKMGYVGPEADFKTEDTVDEMIRKARLLSF